MAYCISGWVTGIHPLSACLALDTNPPRVPRIQVVVLRLPSCRDATLPLRLGDHNLSIFLGPRGFLSPSLSLSLSLSLSVPASVSVRAHTRHARRSLVTSSPLYLSRAQGLRYHDRLVTGRPNYCHDDGGAIFFTKNGRFLGVPFRGVDVKVHYLQYFSGVFFSHCLVSPPDQSFLSSKSAPRFVHHHGTYKPAAAASFARSRHAHSEQEPLYPVIGLDSHCCVTANFGTRAFAFDVPTFEAYITGALLKSSPLTNEQVCACVGGGMQARLPRSSLAFQRATAATSVSLLLDLTKSTPPKPLCFMQE